MRGYGERLEKVLEAYASFLRKMALALPKHQPYLVRWVKALLLFAKEYGGYTCEESLDLFLAGVGGRLGMKPWPIQQAADALRIDREQYRDAHATIRPWSASACAIRTSLRLAPLGVPQP